MINYIINLLIVFDEYVNTLLGGYPDETISLRCARERDLNNKKWACVLCRFLDWFDKDHCTKVRLSKTLSIRYRDL